jgi:hypothetical protein
MPDSSNALGLTDAQLRHSKDIIATAKKMGMSLRDAQIAITVAITESGIRELANSNVPSSLNFPHEGVGSDHSSLGEFQQQTPGWGTVSELMQPHVNAVKFLNALKTKTDRNSIQPWQAAQEVQNSGYSDGSNYRANWTRGSHIASALWGSSGLGDTSEGAGSEPPYPTNSLKPPLTPTQRRKIVAFIEARGMTPEQLGKWLNPLSFGGPVSMDQYINHGNAAQDAQMLVAYAGAVAGHLINVDPKTQETNSIVDAIKGVGGAFTNINDFFGKLGWIFNVDHFMRFVLYAGGAGAVITGVFMIAHSTKDTDNG